MRQALLRTGSPGRIRRRVVLDRYPAFLPSRILLAETLVRLGRVEEAAVELRETASSGSPEEVATYLRQTLTREPGSTVARAGLVHAYLALARPDLARAEHDALARLTPLAEQLAGPRPR